MLIPLPAMYNETIIFSGRKIELHNKDYCDALTKDTRFSKQKGIVHTLIVSGLIVGYIYFVLSSVPADKTLIQAMYMIKPGWWVVSLLLLIPLYLGIVRGIKNVYLEKAYDRLLKHPEAYSIEKAVITSVPLLKFSDGNDMLLRMKWKIDGQKKISGKTPFFSKFTVVSVKKKRECFIALPRNSKGPGLFLGFI